MPYFIYQISEHIGQKRLECLEEHQEFRKAKTSARGRRAKLPAGSGFMVRIVFADNKNHAEALLRQKRETPVLKEWEK